jgi:hypothetical protein
MALFKSLRKKRRIVLNLPVEIEGQRMRCDANMLEIGGGGMALENAEHLPISFPIQVRFTLPPQRNLSLHAVVWWKDGKRTGVRFDPADKNCRAVEEFVEERLAMAAAGEP